MTPAEFFALARKHFSPRTRRVWVGDGRAHIELRTMEASELVRVGEALRASAQEIDAIRFVEVNQGTGRAVVVFRPGALDESELVALVANAELEVGLGRALFGGKDHVLDDEPLERLFLELVADSFGFALGLGLKVSLLPRSRTLGTLASALLVLQSVERLRRPLDDRFGEERVDLALNVLIGGLQGPAQRPLTALVSALEKVALGAEMRAQKRLFLDQLPRLSDAPNAPAPRSVPARPVPLSRGPIEQYSERAWAVALGGFSVSFLSTRSVQRAFAALFGSIPRPALLGREVFSANASRLFASHQMLVRDRSALRILDRVDCLLIVGDLLPEGHSTLGRIVVCSDEGEEECRRYALSLLDRKAPLTRRVDGELSLSPVVLGSLDLSLEVEAEARALSASGELLLGLYRRGRLLALVEVRIRSRLGLEELVRSAREAKMHVVVASNDPNVLSAVPADDAIVDGEELWLAVRELQREGRTVCVVAQGDSRALDVADLGVALLDDGDLLPWSAHVLCLGGIDDVRLLIETCRVAREVSRQSVNVALGAAMLGAIASLGGLLPLTAGRVVTVVNLASLLSMANGLRLGAELAQAPLLPPRDPTPFHALDAAGVLARLGTESTGLAPAEVEKRRPRTRATVSPVAEILARVGDELENPLVPLLSLGAGLSAVVGSFSDAAMVGSVMGLNALISGVQRYRAERAIGALGRRVPHEVVVRRSGEDFRVSEAEVVRGDLLVLAPGDRVLFDCRLVEAQSLEVDASAITGESLPVPKSTQPSFEESLSDRSSVVYAGSQVTGGRGLGVVIAVGDETEASRAGGQYRDQSVSGVERRMRQLMDLTAPVAAVAGVGVILAGLLRGRKVEDVVGSAVSLAVASVPEGLPILATFAQLAAAKRLEARGALVRNVRALEALGRVDTLCFDKTGTLTQGTLELSLVADHERNFPLEAVAGGAVVLEAALRASPASSLHSPQFDPLEASLLAVAERLSLTRSAETGYFEELASIPFESARGFSATLGQGRDGRRLAVKGAPEIVLPRCTDQRALFEGSSSEEISVAELGSVGRARLLARANELASQGFRVLAVAERIGVDFDEVSPDRVRGLAFLGFLAFRDPLRPGIRSTIGEFQRAGLRPVLITGDHPTTASVVASAAGIADLPEVLTGVELAELSEGELAKCVERYDIFARVTPAQKARVIRALTRGGRTVAMVGDGSNDAAAIRLAAIGVAMGAEASEAARGSADLVVADARLETLGSAILEGRAVWDSVRDAVSVLVGGNLGEIGFTLLGGLVSGRPPLSPRQLLLVNLFTDVAPATALAVRPPKQDSLSALVGRGPEASLGTELTRDIIARAIVTASGASLAFGAATLIGDRRGASTTALLALVGTQLGQTFLRGEKSRQVLLTNVATSLALGVLVQTPGLSQTFGCRPLGPVGWSIAVGSSTFATLVGENVPGWLDRFLVPSRLEDLEGFAFDEEPAFSKRPSLLPLPTGL